MLCPRDAGRCLEEYKGSLVYPGKHFCARTKTDCASVSPAEAGHPWKGSEIWNALAVWSEELRLAGHCLVPQDSGCPQFREHLLLDYSSAWKNAKVPRHSGSQPS